MTRGVRGATTVTSDDKKQILEATKELLTDMISQNSINTEDLASAFFSMSPDLHSEFPAVAAREIGWVDVPLFCMQELEINGSLKNCIRVLLHWNTDKKNSEIKHSYLREATKLRPDIS